MKKIAPTFFIALLSTVLYSQTINIGGNQNLYAIISSINTCPESIVVDSPSLFNMGDLVMLYQTKGATINTTNTNLHGNVIAYNNSGRYEWNRIASISGNTIFLQFNLLNSYTPSQGLQLIKVKEIIGNANVNALINTPAYINGKGGITAIRCTGTLNLNANITANNSGFERGIYPPLTSSCNFVTAFTDYFYPSGDWHGAEKGEGIAISLVGQENGRGKLANGGGGGNDHNAGGGGGGNGGNGGQGGTNNEPSLGGCDGFYPGIGGTALNYLNNVLFLGGGGGSGHCNNTATQGGNGGGLIIIDCNAIEGNGNSISANGQNGGIATNDGASGAGAGGTICINTNSWGTTNLSLTANGGNGGNTINLANRCYGPGGGGGGGAILSNIPLTANVNSSISEGINGIITNSTNACNGSAQGASPGTAGIQLDNKQILFAFATTPPNATVTLNPVSDTVCSGQSVLFSSSAIGSGLNYQWQVNAGFGFINILNSLTYNGAFNDTLIINNPNITFNNFVYRVIVTDACGIRDTSNTATLTVLQQPFATALTPDTFVCNNSNIDLNASLFGTADAQQWQILNPGSGFSNIASLPPYSGVQSSTLSISPFTSSINPSIYRFSVSNQCGTNFSDSITVSLLPLPVVNTHPINDTICSGGNATFTAAINNSSQFNWQIFNSLNWVNLSNNATFQNVNSQSLTINNVTNFTSQYRLKALNNCGDSIFTNIVTVIESNSSISISNNPANDTVCVGETASFSVNAIGSNLTHQWQIDNGSGYTNISNNTTYSGTNTSNLNITNTNSSFSSNNFRVIVTDICGNSLTSSPATLIINQPPVINASANTIYYCINDTFNIPSSSTGNPINFQWQINSGSGFINLTENSIYKNTQTPNLQICGAGPLQNNTQYRILVFNNCDTLSSDTSTIILKPTAIINNQPVNAIGCPGSSISFSVSATNVFSYQWQILQSGTWSDLVNNAQYSGAQSNTLNISFLSSLSDSFRVLVIDSCNNQLLSSVVSVNPQNNVIILSSPSSTQFCENSSQLFVISASGNSLTYQWQIDNGSGFINLIDNVNTLGSNNDSLNITNIPFTQNGNTFRVIVTDGCNQSDTSNTFTVTVIQNPSLNLPFSDSTICENSSLLIQSVISGNYSNFQWQELIGGNFSNLSNNATISGSNSSQLNFSNVPFGFNNSNYRIIGINTICGNDTTPLFNLLVNPIPSILNNLTDTTICSSSALLTSINVNSANPVSYQWQYNSGLGFINFIDGVNVTGSQTAQITLNPPISIQNNTDIRVIVIGTCGDDTSNIRNIQYFSSPTINIQPQNTNACPFGSANFSVTSNGSIFQWQVNSGSGFTNLTNNINFNGALTSNLTLNNIPTSMFTDSFRCLVINNCGDSIYTQNVVLLNNPSQIIQQPIDAYVCPFENSGFSLNVSNFNTIQWQISEDGINFTNLTNNNTFSGCQTENLIISNVETTIDSSFFRVVATDFCNQQIIGIQDAQLFLNPVINISNTFSDTFVCSDKLIELKIPASITGINQSNWSTGQVGNTLQIKSNTPSTEEIIIYVTNNFNCESSDTFNITFKDCKSNCNPSIPTAFTPNKDGKNDIFRPIFNCNITKYELKIFNRWGETIFKSNSLNSGWDGTYRNENCDLGVYMFTVDYNTSDFQPKIVSGNVTLIR